jgi:MarR family transcriptional regulator for hemolysin
MTKISTERREKSADARHEVREQGTRINFLVHDVSRMRSTLYDQEVRPLGLTRSQWWVLAQLSRQMPEGMLQTELAKVLEVGKVTLGGLIDRLEASGFVERRPDRSDRRAKRVVVTDQGRAVLKDMVKVSSRLNASIFEGLSNEDIETAERVLAVMKANIKSKLNDASADDLGAL